MSNKRTLTLSKTPENLVPPLESVKNARAIIKTILIESGGKKERDFPPPFDNATQIAYDEFLMKESFFMLMSMKVCELYPYNDHSKFPVASRYLLLTHMAILDLWIFRPTRGGEVFE